MAIYGPVQAQPFVHVKIEAKRQDLLPPQIVGLEDDIPVIAAGEVGVGIAINCGVEHDATKLIAVRRQIGSATA